MVEMKTLGCFGLIAFFALATLGLWFLEGYTIAKFWGWFITPAFEIKTPSIWTCTGLSMLIGFITNHAWAKEVKEQMENDEDSGKGIAKAVILVFAKVGHVAIVLLCGWIVYCIGG